MTDLKTSERRLGQAIADVGPMIVAFSGGVDSSLLALAAYRTLGTDMVAVTANSASLATGELEQCQALAEKWSIPWATVATDELSDERYVANDTDRCYWCKSALMDQLTAFTATGEEPGDASTGTTTPTSPHTIPHTIHRTITLGVNLDDLGDHRPGQEAAASRGARFPLVEAEFSKADVRALAKHWGLEVWDRPAMPCLSSRLPYGTAVTVPLLSRIDRAEAGLRDLGFEDVRVRHYEDTARIELPATDIGRAAELADQIVDAVSGAGYKYVTLDLAGLRSGNLNDGALAVADPVIEQQAADGA